MRLPGLFNLAILSISLMVICLPGKSFAADQGQAEAIDFQQLKAYASMAAAAYQSKSEIRQFCQTNHYTLSHYGNIPALAIAYFLLTNDKAKTQTLAVRGTNSIENVLLNVDVKLTTDPHTGIRLHSGFLQAAEKIYQEIKPRLKPGYVISTTGHSLGGAVALIIALELDVEHYHLQHVVTFGQPKVTNVGGAEKFKHLDIIRVVMPKDLVPLVPFFDPMDINDLDIYWHAGKEVVLLAGNRYAILQGMDSMLRATRFTQEQLSERNIEEHQITQYLAALEQKIPEARQVPFKNDLNLFNLF